MKAIHEELLQVERKNVSWDDYYNKFENAVMKGFFPKKSKKIKPDDKRQKVKGFVNSVYDKTLTWVNKTIQNRFFRLTSLMGLDFFKAQGNTIQFARNIGQGNFKEGRVNRVITDSEWAHAQRMGYTGAGGHVHRVNTWDRFALKTQR